MCVHNNVWVCRVGCIWARAGANTVFHVPKRGSARAMLEWGEAACSPAAGAGGHHLQPRLWLLQGLFVHRVPCGAGGRSVQLIRCYRNMGKSGCFRMHATCDERRPGSLLNCWRLPPPTPLPHSTSPGPAAGSWRPPRGGMGVGVGRGGVLQVRQGREDTWTHCSMAA